MLSPKSLTSRLLQSPLCTPDQLVGCSEDELDAIEKSIRHKLPASYRSLMSVLGKGAGEFLSDQEMFYPSVMTLTEKTRTCVEEEGGKLPEDAFVIANRLGEYVLFFHLDDANSNPAVFMWDCTRPKRFARVSRTLWGYIENELDSMLGEEEPSDED